MAEVKDGGVMGDFIKTKEVTLFNRTGATLSVGDVCAIDLAGGSTEASDFATWVADATPTEGENPLANAVQATATAPIDPSTGIFVVAQESIADNAAGRFAISGVVKVNSGTGSAVSISTRLFATSGSHALADGTSGAGANKVIAVALQAGATTTTATSGGTWAIFDGLGGLGMF